jgi:hypothetical protein
MGNSSSTETEITSSSSKNNHKSKTHHDKKRQLLTHCLGPGNITLPANTTSAALIHATSETEEVETTWVDLPDQTDEASLKSQMSDTSSNPFDELESASEDEFQLVERNDQHSPQDGLQHHVLRAAPESRNTSPSTNKQVSSQSIFPNFESNFDSSFPQQKWKTLTSTATDWLFPTGAFPESSKTLENTKAEEQFHEYPAPPDNLKLPPTAPSPTPPKQPGFFMTPGAYSVPGPSSFSRSSSRGSGTSKVSSAVESDDSSFLRSFYESGDFSDFESDLSDIEADLQHRGSETYVDGLLDIVLKDNEEEEENLQTRRGEDDSISSGEGPLVPRKKKQGLVVAAELTTDAEALLEDRVRRSILQDTAVASVVLTEHGGNRSLFKKSAPRRRRHHKRNKRSKRKNVKEKFFGDGKKNSIEVILSNLELAPDDYIHKRDLLPWTVKKNATTNLWVASVQTNQKAWESNAHGEKLSLAQLRSIHTFSGRTEEEAYEAGLACSPPILQSLEESPNCFLCKSKFAILQRPKHCKNCGVVVCSTCCCSWSSKRVPETYRKNKSSNQVLVCMACDWLATNFQNSLLKGNMSKALALYKSGNINLRTPYGPYNTSNSPSKRRDEIMYPIHMAILGGNVALVQWLVQDRFTPLKQSDVGNFASAVRNSSSKRKLNFSSDNQVLRTSKGRSPVRLALGLEHSDILKLLVSTKNMSLLEEDLRLDYRKVLRHLTVLLNIMPAALLAQTNHLPASVQVVSAKSSNHGDDVPCADGDSILPPGNHLLGYV